MLRKAVVHSDAPQRRSSRIMEQAQRSRAAEEVVTKNTKTRNTRAKKETLADDHSPKPSTVTGGNGNSTARNAKRKVKPALNAVLETPNKLISTLPNRDGLPLPQRLVDIIIGLLKGDKATLKSCTLVSRCFAAQTRTGRYLFPKILIRKALTQEAKGCLLSGSVTPHVRELFLLWNAVFMSDLRSCDFHNLCKLYITVDIWKHLPAADNGVISLPQLTELELRGVDFSGSQRALMFILSFPKLVKLALDGVRVHSNDFKGKKDLLQSIKARPPLLRSLWITDISQSHDNIGFHRFYKTLVELAASSGSLEALYLHGYIQGVRLIRSARSLKCLHLFLTCYYSDHIDPVPLCHIPDVHVGFDLFDLDNHHEPDYDAEYTIQWLTECLKIKVDKHALKYLDVRCTVSTTPDDAHGLKSEKLDELNNVLKESRFSTLKQLSVTTFGDSRDIYDDEKLYKSRFRCLHGEIVKKLSGLNARCTQRTNIRRTWDEDCPVVCHQHFRGYNWFSKTRMSLTCS